MKIEMRCKCGAVFIGEVNDDYERAYQDVITEADEWRKEHNRLCETVHGRNGLDKRVDSLEISVHDLEGLVREFGKLKSSVTGLDGLVGEMGHLHGSWERNIEIKIDSLVNRLNLVPDREIKKQG